MMNIVQTLYYLEEHHETLTVGEFNAESRLIGSFDPHAATLFVERIVLEQIIDLFDLYFSSDKSTGMFCLMTVQKTIESECDIMQYLRLYHEDALLVDALSNVANFVYDKFTNKGGQWYELWSEWKGGR